MSKVTSLTLTVEKQEEEKTVVIVVMLSETPVFQYQMAGISQF